MGAVVLHSPPSYPPSPYSTGAFLSSIARGSDVASALSTLECTTLEILGAVNKVFSCLLPSLLSSLTHIRRIQTVHIQNLIKHTFAMNSHNFTVPSPSDTSPQTPPQRQQQSTTPRPRGQSHMQPQMLSEFVRRRPRSETDSIQTSTFPVYAPTSTPTTRDHLPFSFGAEFEMIVRPRHGKIPEADTNNQLCRKFGLALLKEIAKALSAAGIPAAAFDPCDDEDIDYTIWNVMLDGSLSKNHQCDGFCEIDPMPTLSHPSWTLYRSNRNCDANYPGQSTVGRLDRQILVCLQPAL